MTDDFDFDFDVNRGRSGSRTKDRQPDDATGHGNGRDLADPETGTSGGREPVDGRDLPELDFGFGGIEEPAFPRSEPGDPDTQGKRKPPPPSRRPSRGEGDGNGSGNGSRGYVARAKELLNRGQDLLYRDEERDSPEPKALTGDERSALPTPRRRREPQPPSVEPPAKRDGEDDDNDWLSFDDEELDDSIASLREQDAGPAGPPTPGEARNFAKEARRRASRRPSPILDLNEERERRRDRERDEDGDVDFESMLEHQPQKSGIARRGSAVRNALKGGVESLRRVGGERIAESRGRIGALRERVPSRIPQPRRAGGDGKPPPPRLPRRLSARRPRKPKPGRVKWIRIAIILIGLGMLGIVSLFFGMMMAISRDLPQLENRKEFAEAKNSEVFDDQGNKIGTLLNNNRRVLVESPDISPYMKSATVAIEDERFYEHRGVDIQGMSRALVADAIPGGSTQGASTITQQFVKNALEAQGNRTVLQKFRESALAYHLEDQWDKDKILTEYLNTVYFGEGAYGIEAAARTYFGAKHPGCGEAGGDPCAKELTPAEAAMLAGIITSPSAFSPRVNPQIAIDRRNLVLQKMNEQGYIDDTQYEESIDEAPPAASDIEHPQGDSLSPYFTDWLRQQVVDLYGPGRAFSGGLDVHTTLDLDMQQTAEEIAGGMLSGIAPTAALVVLDTKTAGVKAMVGGYDFEKYPFNLATSGHRQPGSAFKPFTLATALQHGFSSSSCFPSQPKEFPIPGVSPKKEVFEVHNYEDKYLGGCVSLSTATQYSDNSVFAELGVGRNGLGPKGPKMIARTAEEMGIQTEVSDNPAMVLGGLEEGVTPLEMTHAYTTIENSGARVSGNLDTVPGTDKNDPDQFGPVAMSEIDDPDGKAIAKNKTIQAQVIPSNVASTMRTMMSGVISGGTGQSASLAEYGKTGTTENNGDAWFCGVDQDSDLAACVWVGHRDTNTPMETEYNGGPVDGGTWPALIWNAVIGALADIRAQHEAEKESESDDGGDSGDSSPSYSAPSSSSGSSGSSSGGGSTGGGGGGGGGGRAPAPAPAPAPSGGGGGATGGTGGTGGTGL